MSYMVQYCECCDFVRGKLDLTPDTPIQEIVVKLTEEYKRLLNDSQEKEKVCQKKSKKSKSSKSQRLSKIKEIASKRKDSAKEKSNSQKEHDLIKEEEDGELKEPAETKAEEDKEEVEKKEEKAEEINKDPDSFEYLDDVYKKDEKKFHETFSSNQKGLYFKNKAEKSKRQKAQRNYEELKAEYELSQVKDSSYGKKLEKIKEALKGDEVTIEALQSIIGVETEEKQEKQVSEPVKVTEEALKERIELIEGLGKSTHNNFDELTTLATNVVNEKPRYKKQLMEAIADEETDMSEVVDMVVDFAKLSPEFGKEKSEEKESTEEKKESKVDRVIKNSKKKVSSASVGGGGSKRVISHSDLTPEDAESLTTKQWQELPDEVRERLLQGS